jgi:aspartate ammonia-lyase
LTVLSGRIGHDNAAIAYRQHLETGEAVDAILIKNNWSTSEEIDQALSDFRL